MHPAAKNSLAIRWLWFIFCCAPSTMVVAADSNLVLAQSSLAATFKQENVPVDALFRKFSGKIVYDASKPTASSAMVSVDMASFDIGDPAYNAEVGKPAWFDSAHFTQGVFNSTIIKPGAPGHFEATGTLSIKGKTQVITVPITVQSAGNNDAFDGTFELSRKAFSIGDPVWDDVLDDMVHVRFHLLIPKSKL